MERGLEIILRRFHRLRRIQGEDPGAGLQHVRVRVPKELSLLVARHAVIMLKSPCFNYILENRYLNKIIRQVIGVSPPNIRPSQHLIR